MKTKIASFVVLSILALAANSQALSVDVINYSFEINNLGIVPGEGEVMSGIDFPGWVETSGYAGVYNPGELGFSSSINPETGLVDAPDGQLVAYMANSGSVTLQDIEGYTLRQGATLTLQLDVGWWSGLDVPNFEISLVSDGVLLASTSDTSDLAPGTFGNVTLQYDVTDPALEGQNLAIVIAYDGGGLMFFDNVRLTNDGPTPVPEPVTLLLLGAGMFSLGLARSAKKLIRR